MCDRLADEATRPNAPDRRTRAERVPLAEVAVASACAFLSLSPIAWPAQGVSEADQPEPQAAFTPGQGVPPLISLEPGDIWTVSVHELERIAIANPKVADVAIVSANEVLLQAKTPGTTNLLLWDSQGQHLTQIEVLNTFTGANEGQLNRLVSELKLFGVQVRRENEKLFLVGEVERQADLDRLEQMLTAYKDQVTNLVTVAPEPPSPPAALPPSVKLTVQLIEMDRETTDKLGVDWMNSLTVTETSFGALGPAAISQAARIGEAFRLGAFSRGSTGAISAILNLLVSQGKARILAEPKLVAASGKEATAILGVEVPVITATSVSAGTVTQDIEFKKTGVELRFQPTVLQDGGAIQLVIDAKVSSVDKVSAITVGGISVPGFKVRQTQTELVTGPGEAVLIAGLLQDEEKKNLSQVPALGSLPVLGNLFRSTEFVRGRTELVIVVTPELAGEGATTADRSFALDQALASAELAAAIDDPRLRYALQVQERIANVLRYPQREKGLDISETVKLRLHLFADGTLGRVLVSQSSGIEALDLAALRAAETQAPYPPFPPHLAQQELWIEVPVLFRP
jgi:pilus assembly protein CpaC